MGEGQVSSIRGVASEGEEQQHAEPWRRNVSRLGEREPGLASEATPLTTTEIGIVQGEAKHSLSTAAARNP